MAENSNSENETRIGKRRRTGPEAPGPAGGNATRRGGKKWLLLVILIMAGRCRFRLWQHTAGRESTDDAQIDGHINPVASQGGRNRAGGACRRQPGGESRHAAGQDRSPRLSRSHWSGQRRSSRRPRLRPWRPRTQVPVISITTSSQTSGAQASLQSAEAGVAAAAKGVDSAQARLVATRARVQEARAMHTKALQDLERMKQLVAKEEISRQQYDAAVAAADASRAALDGAEAAVAGGRERRGGCRGAPRPGAHRRAPRPRPRIEAARVRARPGGRHEIQRRFRRGARAAGPSRAGQGAARPGIHQGSGARSPGSSA